MPTDSDLRADDTSLGSLAATRGSGPDKGFRYLALACGLLVILALITITTTKAAWPAFANYGTDYFFSTDWRPNEQKFGILAFVWGTVVISLIGIVLAVPVSIGIALFATELAP